jgi:DNA-binding response OmpR family regulator
LTGAVWSDNYPFGRAVDNHTAKPRHKIETDPAGPRFIATPRRAGYKFLGRRRPSHALRTDSHTLSPKSSIA